LKPHFGACGSRLSIKEEEMVHPGRWEPGGVHCRRSLALAGGWLRCGPTTAWPNNGAIRALGCVPRIVGNAVRALGRVAFPIF
jgi:hypothetical protein